MKKILMDINQSKLKQFKSVAKKYLSLERMKDEDYIIIIAKTPKICLRAAADGEPVLEPDNYCGQACTSVIVGDKLYLTDLKPE